MPKPVEPKPIIAPAKPVEQPKAPVVKPPPREDNNDHHREEKKKGVFKEAYGEFKVGMDSIFNFFRETVQIRNNAKYK